MKKLALMLTLGLLSAGAFAAVDVDVNAGVNLRAGEHGRDLNIGYFYESLAPHGEWVQLKDYGYVWQPSVEIRDENWRPYANEGHWLYTDDGWYWASDYDWGWAPFHYGRWTYDNQYHWVWAPDTTWGPAWVAWREGDRHYGWAPLPIGAVFEPNIGLSFHGRHVDAGFDFGIGANFWTFVPQDRFLSNNIASVAISARENESIYRGSRDVNKSYTYNDNRIINNGIPAQSVSRVTKQEVKPMHIESQNAQTPGKAQVSGDKIAAYRPQIKNEKPANADTLIKEAKNRKGEGGAAAQPKSNTQQNAGKQQEKPINTQFERNKAQQNEQKPEANKAQQPEAGKPANNTNANKPAEPATRTPEAKKPVDRNEVNKPAERPEANKPAANAPSSDIRHEEAKKPAERNEVNKPAERPEANKPAANAPSSDIRHEEAKKPAERNEVNKPAPAAPETKRNINEEARRSEIKQQPPHPEANKTPEPRNNPRADDGHRTDMQSTKNDTELRKEEGKR